MEDTFKMKNVTIHIDQTSLERKKGVYWLRSINPENPISLYGKPQEIGKSFGDCLSRTIAAMEKNNCKLIKIDISWE